jgi:hypothetical protein
VEGLAREKVRRDTAFADQQLHLKAEEVRRQISVPRWRRCAYLDVLQAGHGHGLITVSGLSRVKA